MLSKVLFTIFVTAPEMNIRSLLSLWFAFKSSFYNICHSRCRPWSHIGLLWFAFKSSFYNICHSQLWWSSEDRPVVICFQKFFLQYLSQLIRITMYGLRCCDLLSKVLFTIFVTAGPSCWNILKVLWFAFKSSFYNICHS